MEAVGTAPTRVFVLLVQTGRLYCVSFLFSMLKNDSLIFCSWLCAHLSGVSDFLYLNLYCSLSISIRLESYLMTKLRKTNMAIRFTASEILITV